MKLEGLTLYLMMEAVTFAVVITELISASPRTTPGTPILSGTPTGDVPRLQNNTNLQIRARLIIGLFCDVYLPASVT